MEMLKVKFDWSKSKFQQAANAVNAQAAAAAAAAAANRGVQPSTSAQLIVQSTPGLATNPVYHHPSAIKQAAPVALPQAAIMNNGGGNFAPSVGIDDDLTINARPFGSVGSAFTSTTANSGPASGTTQSCCLTEEGHRCSRPAGNASYSKRIQKTVIQKRLRLTIDQTARHIYICEHHKTMIQSARTSNKRKRKDSGDDDQSNDGFGSNAYDQGAHSDQPQPDLGALQVGPLRRMKKFFRLQTRPNINKPQLVEQLLKSFKQTHVNEKEAITYFIYMVKCNRNKLDQPKGAPAVDA